MSEVGNTLDGGKYIIKLVCLSHRLCSTKWVAWSEENVLGSQQRIFTTPQNYITADHWLASDLFANITAAQGSLAAGKPKSPPSKWSLGISHFPPSSSIFRPEEVKVIFLSDIEVGLGLLGIWYASTMIRWPADALLYMSPCMWINHWIVAITYLFSWVGIITRCIYQFTNWASDASHNIIPRKQHMLSCLSWASLTTQTKREAYGTAAGVFHQVPMGGTG